MYCSISSKIQSLIRIFRSPKTEILPDLPEDIISDILLRLPVKSIGRSRCVCKPWLSLLTSYDFVKAHLALHTHEQKLLLHKHHSQLTLHLGGDYFRKLEFFDEPVCTLVGSCNGLVLLEIKFNHLCLINCLTQEYVRLPVSPFLLCPYPFCKYGFGYDSNGDDYKIVSISAPNHDEGNTILDIYSLKMRSWRRFGAYPYDHDILNDNFGVFVNGALHWARLSTSDESPLIAAFDLSSEKFYEIPAPVSIDNSKFCLNKLMVIDGCLGLAVQLSKSVYAEIWLMKSYSMVDSWTKLVIDMEFIHTWWWPYCFHQDKLLFSEGHRSLKWYHLQDGRVEVLCLVRDDVKCPPFREVITYSESLVSPHFNYHQHN